MQVKTRKQEVKVDNTVVAKQHIEMVLNHVNKLGAEGKMVLCSYGQNPETEVDLKSHIVHLTIGRDNSEKINKFIEYVETTPHSNGYMGLQVFDKSLPRGKRGSKKDIKYMVAWAQTSTS